jgi:hypothetical protein
MIVCCYRDGFDEWFGFVSNLQEAMKTLCDSSAGGVFHDSVSHSKNSVTVPQFAPVERNLVADF